MRPHAGARKQKGGAERAALITISVIPAERCVAAVRAGTYFNTVQTSEWVPDRAIVPNGEIAVARPG